jgi:hypothetical protein
MLAKRFIFVIAAVALLGGCFYRKVARVYAKAYGTTVGRVMPSLPSGGGAGVYVEPPRLDMTTIAGVPQAGTPTVQLGNYQDPQIDAQVDQPVDEPAYTPPASSGSTTISYTRTAAPNYPSSPFIAVYPAARGSDTHLCRAFTALDDNKGACMAECRAQLTSGPGSCSCMEMERCPDGTKVVR